jgi:hypothetical protein
VPTLVLQSGAVCKGLLLGNIRQLPVTLDDGWNEGTGAKGQEFRSQSGQVPAGNKHQYSRNQLFISSPRKVNIPDPFQIFLIAYYFAMRMKLLIFEMEFFSYLENLMYCGVYQFSLCSYCILCVDFFQVVNTHNWDGLNTHTHTYIYCSAYCACAVAGT